MGARSVAARRSRRRPADDERLGADPAATSACRTKIAAGAARKARVGRASIVTDGFSVGAYADGFGADGLLPSRPGATGDRADDEGNRERPCRTPQARAPPRRRWSVRRRRSGVAADRRVGPSSPREGRGHERSVRENRMAPKASTNRRGTARRGDWMFFDTCEDVASAPIRRRRLLDERSSGRDPEAPQSGVAILSRPRLQLRMSVARVLRGLLRRFSSWSPCHARSREADILRPRLQSPRWRPCRIGLTRDS